MSRRLLALARRLAALLDDDGALGRALVADLDAGIEAYLAALREGLCPRREVGGAAHMHRRQALALAAAGIPVHGSAGGWR